MFLFHHLKSVLFKKYTCDRSYNLGLSLKQFRWNSLDLGTLHISIK